MDKLEQFKNENPDNDTLIDNDAASAYVESFALEVFDRAKNAMDANKVTRQTADTFLAAVTFLQLCQIWGPLDPEIAAKIKFAKFHSVRILKAIKAGEDPNATNPVQRAEESPEVELDQLESEAQGPEKSAPEQAVQPLQPSVEDVPDEPSGPSPIFPQPPSGLANPPANGQGPPLDLPSAPASFDRPPSTSIPSLPDAPGSTSLPAQSSLSSFKGFQSFPPPTTESPPSPTVSSHDPSSFYGKPDPNTGITKPPEQPSGASLGKAAPISRPTPVPEPANAPTRLAAAPKSRNLASQSVDDNSIALAQKHARWAVSALTFDDVDTAIKELRNSLRYLGAE
ncbi:hypothetical protein MAP00_000162 [Monascus purpureus]|nr:hypothetical protein MAP00_000162 [Monascus purpureus]